MAIVDANDVLKQTKKVGNWKKWQQQLNFAQMIFGVVMQLSYVAFPAYNFSIAIWAAFCSMSNCPKRMWAIYLSVLPLSIVGDSIWISLWVTGKVFANAVCSKETVGILTCGGNDSFPGCRINRISFVMMVLNIIAKAASIVCTTKMIKENPLSSNVSPSSYGAKEVHNEYEDDITKNRNHQVHFQEYPPTAPANDQYY